VIVSLSLPAAPAAVNALTQSVPVAPPTTSAGLPAGSYERVWTNQLEVEGEVDVQIAAAHVLVAADGMPLEARSIEKGAAIWKSAMAFGDPPVIRDGRVVGIADGRLQAVTLDRGEPLWTVALDGTASAPALVGDAAVVMIAGELRAYRAEDGSVLWQQPLGAALRHPPIAAGQLVVATLASQEVAAFDRQTGQPRWRTRLDSAPSPMGAGRDHVFFGTASGICALALRDGRLSWCFRIAPVPPAGPPLIEGDSVYFAMRDNTFRVFDAGGGTLERLERLPARPTSGPLRAGDQMAVPLTTGGVALVSVSPKSSAPVLAFEPARDHQLQSAAASADGAWLVTLTIDFGGARTLTGYQRKATAPPAKSP